MGSYAVKNGDIMNSENSWLEGNEAYLSSEDSPLKKRSMNEHCLW